MILHKETYKKFGYWPNKLSYGSNKKVLWKCKKCSSVFSSVRRSITENTTYYCVPCFLSDRNRKAKPRILLNKENFKLPNFDNLIDLYFCASLKNNLKPSAKNNERKPRWQIFGKKNGKSYALPMIESLSLMKELDLEIDSNNKDIKILFKNKLKNYLLDKTNNTYNLLHKIMNNNKTLMHVRHGQKDIYSVSDKCGIMRDIFDKLNFKYHPRCRNTYTYKIDIGSFFINNKWVHIG